MNIITLIVGPPGAGKSTLAADMTSDGGLHLEREQFKNDREFKRAVLLATSTDTDEDICIVRTCPTLADEVAWQRFTQATVTISLATPPDVCLERVQRRDPNSWRRKADGINGWHSNRAILEVEPVTI